MSCGWVPVSVKGMNLVRELEKDLKIANVICKNGQRHLTSSRNEVSRDLVVTESSKKKQALLEMLPILTELRHAVDMQAALDTCVEEANFSKAFQVLSEYLQVLDSLSELSAVQEMSRGVEVWLGKTLQKLDSLLLEVCQDFKEDAYLTVVDAYALIGDVSALAEKIQSFFMQEVLSESHSALRTILQEVSFLCFLKYQFNKHFAHVGKVLENICPLSADILRSLCPLASVPHVRAAPLLWARCSFKLSVYHRRSILVKIGFSFASCKRRAQPASGGSLRYHAPPLSVGINVSQPQHHSAWLAGLTSP
ncbi:UNVERIFIED_CONTAM: hypothetical protein Scaly_0361500 [Sesamum calycinum]|uniref:Vacuolar protein sorting-associated protein 54 N-terminal domain-containing protein n=1 Tax=Sesamum calycinum TaxID=2727403 RepID=A0AAW2SC70_9LAMI